MLFEHESLHVGSEVAPVLVLPEQIRVQPAFVSLSGYRIRPEFLHCPVQGRDFFQAGYQFMKTIGTMTWVRGIWKFLASRAYDSSLFFMTSSWR